MSFLNNSYINSPSVLSYGLCKKALFSLLTRVFGILFVVSTIFFLLLSCDLSFYVFSVSSDSSSFLSFFLSSVYTTTFFLTLSGLFLGLFLWSEYIFMKLPLTGANV